MSKTMKIIWPIHPSDAEPHSDARILNFLQRLKVKWDFEIQPVSVVSAAYFTTAHYFEPIDTQILIENIKQDCVAYLDKFPGMKINSPLVLENQFSSQTAEVQLFTEFVTSYGADLVLMSSNGRKGWARHFLGSFTENFIIKSDVPVLVFGPECEDREQLASALMPVELSESSEKFVEVFVNKEPHHNIVDQLTLFHKISMVDLEDITWAPTLYGLGGEQTDNVLKRAKDSSNNFLSRVSEKANMQSSLKVDYAISDSLDPVAQVILEKSRDKKTDLIVMRSDAGPVAARVLGSVVRSVVRESAVPVIVYPHKYNLA